MGSPANGIEVLFASLERNNFFYGKMLDVRNLKLEQSYFIRRRWTLNRLLGGAGVVCGLNLTPDAAQTGRFTLAPGLALDCAGREIVVAEPVTIDATGLTDNQGRPAGPAPAGSTVEIRLAYAEQKRSPVPVMVADCDHPGNCAPDLIAEEYRILVREAAAVPPGPPVCPIPGTPFTYAGLHGAIEPLVTGGCAGIPADTSIPLARFTASSNSLDELVKPLVYSNALLYGLIACLAERVSQLAGAVQLLYVSGDNQSAPSGATLPQPIVVRAVDQAGNPVTGLAVTFSVTAGGGAFDPVVEKPGGLYEAKWKMGPPGPQSAIAKTPGSALTVALHAVSQ